MIDYETFCKIKHSREQERLTLAQTARTLGLHPLTVAKWAKREQYRARQPAPRPSKLDPFKPYIMRWLETHPLSDIGSLRTVRASRQFRITLETNRYSVPAEYASTRVTLKTYPDRLCIYHQEKLIARHARTYERYQDIEDPDHQGPCSSNARS